MGKLLQVDWTQALNFDDEELFLYQLTDRQALLLLGQTDYLAWKTRYANLTLTAAELIELRDRINHRLMTPVTVEVDCADIEDCLETSTTIININNEVNTNSTNITTNSTNITNQGDTINNHTQQLQDIAEDGFYNELPDPPTQETDEDGLCASSWWIARELNAIIQDLITGTLWSNVFEFVQFWLNKGGWKYIGIMQLWSLFQAISNPSLSAEVTAAIEFVAEAFFCNDLDREGASGDINASGDISNDAKTLYIAIIEAWTEAYFNLATVIGLNNAGEDCAGWCDDDTWVLEVPLDSPKLSFVDLLVGVQETNRIRNALSGQYKVWIGINYGGSLEVTAYGFMYSISPTAWAGSYFTVSGFASSSPPVTVSATETEFKLFHPSDSKIAAGQQMQFITSGHPSTSSPGYLYAMRIYGRGTIPAQMLPYKL